MTRLDDLKQRIGKCKTAGEMKILLNDEFLCINCTSDIACGACDCTTAHDDYYAEEIKQ